MKGMRCSRFSWLAVFLAALAFVSTVRAQPHNADYDSGLAAYNRSDWDGAITNFTKAIAVGFDLDDSYSYRAYAESQKGQSNAAIADCNEVIRIDPTGYFWRARVELGLTNISAAVADFKMGKTLQPKMLDDDLAAELAHYYFDEGSRFYFEMGDMPAALTNYSLALSIDPNYEGVCVWLAWLEELSGRHARALMDADTAVELGRERKDVEIYPLAYITRAFARVECNVPAGVLDDCRQAIDQDQKWLLKPVNPEPNSGRNESINAEILLAKGLEAFINGDNQGAVQMWQQSWDDTNRAWELSYNSSSNHIAAIHGAQSIMKSYLDSWIAKAQLRLQEKSPQTNSTSIQPAIMAK